MTKRPALLTLALWLIPLAFLAYFFYQPLIAIFRVVFSERFSQGWEFLSGRKLADHSALLFFRRLFPPF